MPTINGIGTKFHGFRRDRSDDTLCVTSWFVFLYFPVIPVSAYRIRIVEMEKKQYGYEVLEKIPLNGKEILTTYFWGWVIAPVLWFWPIPFAVREVGQYFGYVDENGDGMFQRIWFVFVIAWIAVFAWKWKDWEERRGIARKS